MPGPELSQPILRKDPPSSGNWSIATEGTTIPTNNSGTSGTELPKPVEIQTGQEEPHDDPKTQHAAHESETLTMSPGATEPPAPQTTPDVSIATTNAPELSQLLQTAPTPETPSIQQSAPAFTPTEETAPVAPDTTEPALASTDGTPETAPQTIKNTLENARAEIAKIESFLNSINDEFAKIDKTESEEIAAAQTKANDARIAIRNRLTEAHASVTAFNKNTEKLAA